MPNHLSQDDEHLKTARELIHEFGLIDLHVDTFIPYRLFGYDIFRRHKGGNFFGQLDLPRLEEAGLTGAMWSITTNILRRPSNRWPATLLNWCKFHELIAKSNGRMQLVRNVSEYEKARKANKHAVFLSIQGANAFEFAPEGVTSLSAQGLLTRATLVHMTNSVYGATSCPYLGGWMRRDKGLTQRGVTMIEQLNDKRIFLDLSHIHPQGFSQALEVHDQSQPVIVTHTGVCGVNNVWRNLSDEQIQDVAETGGVIGILFHKDYLYRQNGPDNAEMVLEHLEHVINIAGEDSAAIGSDYDGFIRPPTDLNSAEHYPWLVTLMLKKNWSTQRIHKILSANFLRALKLLRP